MKPLSKQIGEWDNAQKESEKQQRENTIGEIKRCINGDSKLLSIKNKGHLNFKVRGSISKGNDTTKNSDLDLHIIFINTYNLSECKDYIHSRLNNCFSRNNVKRNTLTFSVLANINRIKADVLVGIREDSELINALDDRNQSLIPFYPDLDEENINKINADYNHNYSKMVRTYKGLKYEMSNNGYSHATNKVTSFMIECLLYNCNNDIYDFNRYINQLNNELKYRKMFLDLKNAIFSAQLASYELGKEYLEINGKKDLFLNKKSWQNVRKFFVDINKYLKENYNVNE